jgi:tripartite-type tricarboxylate transporter receptor subunit TctC
MRGEAMACLKRAIVLVAVMLGALAPARADDYPSRPVRLIHGFGAASATDITARVLAKYLGDKLGQQFVVEGRPGGASSIATEFVARAPKDGYTLLLGTSANLINAAMTPNLAFDFAKDFAPITLIASTPLILVVHPSTGAKNVQDLIALAKSKPGEILFGSAGVGTTGHLSGELFNLRAGVKMVHVPYQGSPQAVTDLLAGRTSVLFSPASSVLPHVAQGKLIALASATVKRAAIAPDVPSMAEAGLPDFDTSTLFGLLAPAGTPREVIEKLSRASNDALKSDEVLAAFRPQGLEPVGGSPDDFARIIASEIAKWSGVATATGLKK